MLVRAAGAADIDQVMRLRALWRDAAITAEFVASFGRWFQDEQSRRWWWLAIDDAGVGVGMVNVKLFERMPSPTAPASRWGYLANLFVVPPVRGAGVGSRLVEAAVDRAAAEGLVRLVLSPSELSTPLCRRLGFREADELLVHPLHD